MSYATDTPETLPADVSAVQPHGDLSALSWVHAELRRSLEQAHKSLRRYLKEAVAASGSDVDVVDPAVLRSARAQLHQSVGALELVGLPAGADMLRASEAAVQRMVSRPALVTTAAVETIERASFALLDLLARQLAGKPISPVLLFPQYRAVQQLAGADRVHPADLWKIDWQWHELPSDTTASARPADDLARAEMEMLTLAIMRSTDGRSSEGGEDTLTRMSDLCADLAAGAQRQSKPEPYATTLWQMASAVFEAQAQGLLAEDVYAKRLASRLLAQLRMHTQGQREVSERLAQDLLFFCSHARAPKSAQAAPRLAAVRQAWRLDQQPTGEYETSKLGRFDPALLALARKRVATAKDAWSAVAGAEMHRLPGLNEQFALVGESLHKLLPEGPALALALQQAVAQTVSSNAAPPPALAMEVATATLYLDATLEDGEFDDPELASRVSALAQRVEAVRVGEQPQPLDNWMEELYRRVSERQTMGSVVQELRASLSEVEKQVDQFFRAPAQTGLLMPVPGQLTAMRGVLSVLGMDQASAAVLHMRQEVDALAAGSASDVHGSGALPAGFERLADNLGALSFLIDMLSVQPQLAKSMFRFDADKGRLSAVMGRQLRAPGAAPSGAPSARPAPNTRPASVVASPLLAAAPAAAVVAAPAPSMVNASLPERLRALAQAAQNDDIGDQLIGEQAGTLVQQAAAAEHAELSRLLARVQRVLQGHAGADAAFRRGVRAELVSAVHALSPAPAPLPAPTLPVPPASPSAAPVAAGDSGLEDDAEMREIFIEEARDVISDAREALSRMEDAADDSGGMTVMRRSFHTLKGSSRMVGLKDFGEAAWACEQLYNARLASAPRMDATLRNFSADALDYLAEWADAIEAGAAQGAQSHHHAAAVSQAADALRLEERVVPISRSGAAPSATPLAVPAAAPAAAVDLPLDIGSKSVDPGNFLSLPALNNTQSLNERVPGLPSSTDLDLSFPSLSPATAPALPTFAPAEPAPAPAASEVSFDLHLGDFDDALTAVSLTPAAPLPAPTSSPDLLLDFDSAPAPLTTSTELRPADQHVDVPLEATAFDAWPSSVMDLPLDFATQGHDALPAIPQADVLEIDLNALAPEQALAQAIAAHSADPGALPAEATLPMPEEEQVRVIGPLRIGIPLFNIYLNEADELSRRLCTELAEWSHVDNAQPVGESSAALAHSLAGSSATVGYSDLSALARALEHALLRSHAHGPGRTGEAALFVDAAEEIRRLLHQFAAGFLHAVPAELMQRLSAHEELPDSMLAPLDDDSTGSAPAADIVVDVTHFAVDQVVHIDAELFPVFEEEADELLPQLQNRLRDWQGKLDSPDAGAACMRTLHTLKGGARLAGASALGERVHALESCIEHLLARSQVQRQDVDGLLDQSDAISVAFEDLRRAMAATVAVPAPVVAPVAPVVAAAPLVPTAPALQAANDEPPASAVAAPQAPRRAAQHSGPVVAPDAVDWQRFASPTTAPTPEIADAASTATNTGAAAVVRVRASLLDRLVNQAGEVSIARARIDGNVKTMQQSLGDLTDSLERMRRQLRDIEVQADTQISTRIEAAKAAAQEFDPLEMDRFTRFQELTRFMAESVNDVATLQRSLQRTLQLAEDELAAQARLTRELQDDLLRTRMVEFDSMSERLHRTARLAAGETGKQVQVQIVGGGIEIDRGVLERMAGSFEHLLRNSVAHGVEAPAARGNAGKSATGQITVTVAQAGNEVGVEFADDGAGLSLARIAQRAQERGLMAPGSRMSDDELVQMIFKPGFSTADRVTELAGRGVGLDVVRAEVTAMGGRIETVSQAGQGTRFKLLLPLTTAVTQVVMLRCGDLHIAVPSTLVEVVRRVPNAVVDTAYSSGSFAYADEAVPFFWLAALLQQQLRGPLDGRTQTVVVIRSASQRVAVHVDEVLGNQEVVVKNVGPQLARLPGLAGVTLLPSGAAALIYNPVALSALYGAAARERLLHSTHQDAAMTAYQSAHPNDGGAATAVAQAMAPRAPLVMVVDDSLTVRRVTQRLLVREGYRVVTAKDGLDALERLAQERPVVLLSDIEMPRMDGFDLLRNVRSMPALQGLPVVMITSRTAQKHRDYAAELGADHYLGKPYSEEELLGLVARYAGATVAP